MTPARPTGQSLSSIAHPAMRTSGVSVPGRSPLGQNPSPTLWYETSTFLPSVRSPSRCPLESPKPTDFVHRRWASSHRRPPSPGPPYADPQTSGTVKLDRAVRAMGFPSEAQPSNHSANIRSATAYSEPPWAGEATEVAVPSRVVCTPFACSEYWDYDWSTV